jgi:predicted DCC family thiol-disulfide oxidoreductase YuxK
MKTSLLTVFYDGLCPLCSREIVHYRKHAPADAVQFLDFTAPGFDAAAHGLDPKRIREVMHAKVGDELRTGLDAFIALWEAIPGLRWLARLSKLPGVHLALLMGYVVFARLRPWLPRRRREECTAGGCVSGGVGRPAPSAG